MRSMSVRADFGSLLESLNLTGKGAEIGVFKGDFAEIILDHWKGRELLLVDAWKRLSDYLDSWNLSDAMMEQHYQLVRQRMAAHSNRVRILRMLSLDAARTVTDGSLDFIYVDANHSYRATLSDLRAWYPKVRPGGLISGHDYFDARADAEFEPIRSELTQSLPKEELTSYGVKSAVDEFVGPLNVELLVTEESEPTWYFRKPGALAA